MQTNVDRVRSSGVASASPIDLLAVGFSRRESDATQSDAMARDLLRRMQKIDAINDLTSEAIQDATGLEGFEILRCQALIELGRRAAKAGKGRPEEIDTAEDVASLLDHLRREKKEHFCAILLDSKNALIKVATIHIGTLTFSVVGAREVFGEALREGASSIIVAHNHPSGDPAPSPEDLDVTEHLVKIGKLLDIPVLDHVIIGDTRHVSLKERGAIK